MPTNTRICSKLKFKYELVRIPKLKKIVKGIKGYVNTFT